jgi:hypothetical protein
MNVLARKRVVHERQRRTVGGQFKTMDEGMKKNGDGKNPNGSYGKTKRGKYLVKLAKVK